MRDKSGANILSFVLPAAVFTAVAAANIWYAYNHSMVNMMEEIHHLAAVYWAYHFDWLDVFKEQYPPFVYIATLPFLEIFGVNRSSASLVNILFMAITFGSTYSIGLQITKDKYVGLLAAFLSLVFPMAVYLSRHYMLDFPLAAMTTLSFAMLIKTENFASIRWSVAYGMVCGFGLLTRNSFAVFAIGPFLIEAIGFRSQIDKSIRKRNLVFASLTVLIIIAPYYFPSLHEIATHGMDRITRDSTIVGQKPIMPFFHGIIFYFINTLNVQLSALLTIFLALALPFFIRAKIDHKWSIVLWILVPFLVFSVISWKCVRFLLPALPAIALILSAGLSAIPNKIFKIVATGACFMAGGFQLIWITFPIHSGTPIKLIDYRFISRALPNWLTPLDFQNDIYKGLPEKRPSPYEKISDAIIETADKEINNLRIVHLINYSPETQPEESTYQYNLASAVNYFILQAGMDSCIFQCEWNSGNPDCNLDSFHSAWKSDRCENMISGKGATGYAKEISKADFLLASDEEIPVTFNIPDTFRKVPIISGAEPAIHLFVKNGKHDRSLINSSEIIQKSNGESTRSDEMVLIPSGSFMMGCSVSDSECFYHESPIHQVSVDSFYIDQYETTNGQYETCVKAGVCNPSTYADNPKWNVGNKPVVGVTWNDADTYCKWIGKKLPTEAQWEYAARAGCSNARCGKLDDIAWHWSNAGQVTHPIGLKKPNGWQLFDMIGNAEEWCMDYFDDGFYDHSPKKNPVNKKGPMLKVLPKNWDSVAEKLEETLRVSRGASWDSVPRSCRLSHRVWNPEMEKTDFIGFRCAKDHDPLK